MAHCYQLALMSPASTFTRMPLRSCRVVGRSRSNAVVPGRVKCSGAAKLSDEPIVRRSANYQPTIWGYDFVQSLKSHVGKPSEERADKLKEEVRLVLDSAVDSVQQLELIDDLQRLGLSYQFKDEIKRILDRVYETKRKQDGLYAAALEFRLLRQHYYDVPADVFNNFSDEKGNFNSCGNDDCKGILSLYEAAFLLKEEESKIFHYFRNFAATYLKEYIKDKGGEDEYVSSLVKHALELPLHWRMPRIEARWFVDVYETRHDCNPILLELAKLHFNILQATHQQELKDVSSWWRNTGIGEKLNFARDRLLVSFFWNLGLTSEAQFGYFRRMMTKVNALITIIDDVYDVYGTMDELELFTDAIERWDANSMEQLPEYMKIVYLALFNSVNDMASHALKVHGVDIIPYLKKTWADLCKSFLLEAKWHHDGHIPTLAEYMNNAWISISGPVLLVHAYFLATDPITEETIECLEEYSNIIRWSSMILRLADDLGTASDEMEKGDVAKSIQCYMHETGASEEDGREHIGEMVAATWLKMNRDRLENPHLSTTFIDIAMNLGRMAQCIYQHGDGHGIEVGQTRDNVLSLLVNPIQVQSVDSSG
ncbi:terpene synthase 10-like [Mangifera indica]|uniref:terpene synthase 10-like n=1 Tax=Mangifera indica TaxID=29780 RepID=UPI001CFB61CD|nr:terpene synthase 10-like [Mangifera indica]